jgi:hypothetical protein
MTAAQLIKILLEIPEDKRNKEVLIELNHDTKLPIKEVYKEENEEKIIIRGPA